MQELNVAEHAAQTAGAILADYFRRGVEVQMKAACNPVSEADLAAERAIVDVIRKSFPSDAILGEEEHVAALDAPRLWIVDPLDGTTNFAHQLPHFAVSIAFYDRGQAACGVVLNPIRGDHYHAIRGAGAFHNGSRMHVAPHQSLSETLVGVGFYYDRGEKMLATLAAIRDLFGQQIHGVRRFGTAALDLCQVAAGQFGAYFEYELAPWDFAAGRLIVEEAGGRVTDCLGQPLPLNRTSVLASNPHLHAPVLEIVRQHFPGGPTPPTQ